MILGLIGLLILACSGILFLFFLKEEMFLYPVVLLILAGLGLSILDPVFLIPLGKFIMNLPWIGGV